MIKDQQGERKQTIVSPNTENIEVTLKRVILIKVNSRSQLESQFKECLVLNGKTYNVY